MDNGIDGLMLQAEAARLWRSSNPEGITVLVVTPDRELAEAVAPLLAKRLYPGRTFGGQLHVEQAPEGWEVTLQDGGPNHMREAQRPLGATVAPVSQPEPLTGQQATSPNLTDGAIAMERVL